MSKVITATSLGLAFCFTLALGSVASAAPDAKKILDAMDDMYRGDSAHGKMVMSVQTANWSRTLELEFWSKGEERSLIRILSPKKEKGTATLKVEKNIWNYLPKVKRVIKVPSSMMGGSWMGSHFTNDDLVSESRMADDYTYEITFEGEREGQKTIEVTCVPSPDAAVVWGKVVVEVTTDSIPIRSRYFDEDMVLSRTMTFSNVQNMGGRRIPTISKIVPADKPDEYTQMEYKEMKYDAALDDDLFTLRKLQR